MTIAFGEDCLVEGAARYLSGRVPLPAVGPAIGGGELPKMIDVHRVPLRGSVPGLAWSRLPDWSDDLTNRATSNSGNRLFLAPSQVLKYRKATVHGVVFDILVGSARRRRDGRSPRAERDRDVVGREARGIGQRHHVAEGDDHPGPAPQQFWSGRHHRHCRWCNRLLPFPSPASLCQIHGRSYALL